MKYTLNDKFVIPFITYNFYVIVYNNPKIIITTAVDTILTTKSYIFVINKKNK